MLANNIDTAAEMLASRLGTRPVYLTKDHASWYILAKHWMPPADDRDDDNDNDNQFVKEWSLHPEQRHPLKLFGKVFYENRWSQSWGVSYSYSGSTNRALPVEESTMVPLLIDKANDLTDGVFYKREETVTPPYNGCLQNWYEPDDTIGLHADDEKDLVAGFPIFSLSWGGTRRFLLKSRETREKVELWLENGDLLVMGGTCQQTHRHEVPKPRVTKDPPTSNRINWTIRAFKASVA